MKQRLLVMNGQKLLQSEQGGQWATTKVEKAGAIKPGIYNIHLAMPADKVKSHDGLVLHLDKEHLYQQVGKCSSGMPWKISARRLRPGALPAFVMTATRQLPLLDRSSKGVACPVDQCIFFIIRSLRHLADPSLAGRCGIWFPGRHQ